eukprot:g2476.t1
MRPRRRRGESEKKKEKEEEEEEEENSIKHPGYDDCVKTSHGSLKMERATEEDMSAIVESMSRSTRLLEESSEENKILAEDIEIRIEQLRKILHQSFEDEEDLIKEFRASERVADLVSSNSDLLKENDELKSELDSFHSILESIASKQQCLQKQSEEMNNSEVDEAKSGANADLVEDVVEKESQAEEIANLKKKLTHANAEVKRVHNILENACQEEEANILVHESFVMSLKKENEGLRQLLKIHCEDAEDSGDGDASA